MDGYTELRYPRVIYLGGAPMLGKTTVARLLACRLGYCMISTDDIGIAIAAITPKDHQQEIDYREYYILNNKEKLIQDVNYQHKKVWPAIQMISQKHEAWGHPIVIEGWALRPSNVYTLSGDVSGIFLLADDSLIENRVRSSDFSEGASNVALMIERYCERSIWFNKYIRDGVARLGLRALLISDGMQAEEIVDKCLELIS